MLAKTNFGLFWDELDNNNNDKKLQYVIVILIIVLKGAI